MKLKTIFSLGFILLLSLSLYSQERREKMKEQFESKRVAFLSDKLDLKPEEAQKFWPVYNMFNDEKEDLRQSLKEDRDTELEDKEAEVLLGKMIELEEEALSIKKNYIAKFKNVIGARKTLMLFRLDRQFKEGMMKEIRERRGDKKQRRRE